MNQHTTMRFRIRVCAYVSLLVFICITLVEAAAVAGDEGSAPKAGFGDNGITVGGKGRGGEDREAFSLPPGAQASDPYQYKYDVPCSDGGTEDMGCFNSRVNCEPTADGLAGLAVVWWKAPAGIADPEWTFHSGPTCLYERRPEDVLPRIAGMIQSEFQKLPINAGAVTSQPSPHTLRGAETNFYANTIEQQFDVTILGQKVHIVATPVEYTWNYGDGTIVGPQPSAGGALPEGQWGEKTRTSHAYAQTGDFNVVLTSHFRGTYSVNGGPPLPIPGQGSFSSAPVAVSVWRSVTRNYADNCLQNPQGDGCRGSLVR